MAQPVVPNLHRMATGEPICPYGFKTLDLLKHEGFEVDDHKLTSRLRATALSVASLSIAMFRPMVWRGIFSAPAGDQASIEPQVGVSAK